MSAAEDILRAARLLHERADEERAREAREASAALHDALTCADCGEPVDPADAACCTTNNLCADAARDCPCWSCTAYRAAAEPLED